MSMDTAFQRLNFFTGFFTTADDWNQGQEYHLEKRKLHNRGLHTAGVIDPDPEVRRYVTWTLQQFQAKGYG